MSGRPRRRNNRASAYAQQQQQQQQQQQHHHHHHANQPGAVPKEEPSVQLHDEADLISFRSDALARFVANQEYMENVTSKYIHTSKIIPPSSFPPKLEDRAASVSAPTAAAGGEGASASAAGAAVARPVELAQLKHDDVYFGTLSVMREKLAQLQRDQEALAATTVDSTYFTGKNRELEFEQRKSKELAQLSDEVRTGGARGDASGARDALAGLTRAYETALGELASEFSKEYSVQPKYRKLSAQFDVQVASAPADYDPREIGTYLAAQREKQERERQERERERLELERQQNERAAAAEAAAAARAAAEAEERAKSVAEAQARAQEEAERAAAERAQAEAQAQARAKADAEAAAAAAAANRGTPTQSQSQQQQQQQQSAGDAQSKDEAEGQSQPSAPLDYQGHDDGMEFMNDYEHRDHDQGANPVGVSAAAGAPGGNGSGFAMMVSNDGAKGDDNDNDAVVDDDAGLDNIFDNEDEVLPGNPIMNDDMDNLINFQGDDEDLIGGGTFDQDFLSQIDHSME